MAQYLVAYLFTGIVFLGIDFVWLTRIAKPLYYEHLGDILLESPRMAAAAGFYAFYIIGILIFAVAPALRTDSLWTALVYGALFGLFTYGTYDMTNYATLRHWSLTIAAIDIAWGTLLTGTSALVGTWLTRLILPSA